jgi:tRNA-dihydrouridine synthase 3
MSALLPGALSMSEINQRNPQKQLVVLPQYCSTTLPSCLAPREEEAPRTIGSSDPRSDNTNKKKGQNKKRSRDAVVTDDAMYCISLMNTGECRFADGDCKYSHDIAAFLATKPPDLAPRCVLYDSYGVCSYGINCRYSGCHSNADGSYIPHASPKPPPATLNVLPNTIAVDLRRNKFPFSVARGSSDYAQNGKLWAIPHKPAAQEQDLGEFKPNKRDPDEENERRRVEHEAKVAAQLVKKQEAAAQLDRSVLMDKSRRKIDFDGKIYIAPLTTVGNLPFRRIMKEFGADITCGEMALCANLLQGQASEWALLKKHHTEDVFGTQLAGGFPDQFARVAEVVEREMQVDFIDMNLGCPIDLVCNKGGGAALMLKPNKLRNALIGMGNVFSGPVTVKIRTGWDDKDPFADKLTCKVQEWMLPNVTAMYLHGRSRLQRYSKLANWDYISEVAQAMKVHAASTPGVVQIPLIGNGDVMSYTDFEERRREGVSNTAMLARGALIKPWLPTEIKEKRHWDISATERFDIVKKFVDYGLEHWGSDQKGVNITRRFLLEWLCFLCRYVPPALVEMDVNGPQKMNERPPPIILGRSDLETIMSSGNAEDWVRISEMTILGKVPEGFKFEPKHKANSYASVDTRTGGTGPREKAAELPEG